jgi:hypothetical protein
MLEITVDVYSGRPNPVRVITDDTEARGLLRTISEQPALLRDADSEGILGFRGFQIATLGDDLSAGFGLPPTVYLPASAEEYWPGT